MKRVVVTGSECTGKTTLAKTLAIEFDTIWVPEYSRDYALGKPGPLDASDVEPIARGQIALEDSFVQRAGSLLIQDTDLLSTLVYSRHYYGSCPEWIEEECNRRRPDLYLLLHPDVPWIADGIRDRENRRLEMHALFREALHHFGNNYIDITGDWSTRKIQSVESVQQVIKETRA